MIKDMLWLLLFSVVACIVLSVAFILIVLLIGFLGNLIADIVNLILGGPFGCCYAYTGGWAASMILTDASKGRMASK
jgi:hypothetical protein